jgi:hypothetical protein
LAQAQKRCPICDTNNPKKAAYCMNCGASLTHAEVSANGPAAAARAQPGQPYDFRYGETDLSEDGLRGKARAYFMVIVGTILAVLVGVGVFLVAPLVQFTPAPTPTADAALLTAAAVTDTPFPTLALATVTQGPPTETPSLTPSLTFTPSPTNTPEPCVQTVGAGEGMLALISRCGHRDLDVIPLVVTLNGLSNENDLRANQTILIPFPTPTTDPNAAPPAASPDAESSTEGETSTGEGESVMVSSGGGLSEEDIRATQVFDPFFAPTPTNPPGVGEYRIVSGDTIISVIAQFDTTIAAIDQLNPQIQFLQCEMGQRFGGPSCIVNLFEGQLIRVPVPLPPPTLTPSPSGSETPTPTATATYNAPTVLSPSNRAYFRRDQAVTLRWGATGTLATSEVYLVTVQNLTDGIAYDTETREQLFVVPRAWQSSRVGQVEYVWTIAIADAGDPDSARYITPLASFTWEGQGEPTP